jgi:hypothetical protein
MGLVGSEMCIRDRLLSIFGINVSLIAQNCNRQAINLLNLIGFSIAGVYDAAFLIVS